MSICHLAVMFSLWCNTHKSRSVFGRFWLSENKHGSGAVIQITRRVLVSSKRGGGCGRDPIPVITRGLNFVLRVPRRWARICCSHSLLPGLGWAPTGFQHLVRCDSNIRLDWTFIGQRLFSGLQFTIFELVIF